MFNLVKFKTEHVLALAKQPMNVYLNDWIESGHAEKLEQVPVAFTGFVNDEITVFGGITEYWPDRGHLWSVFSENCKRNFLPTFRGVRKFLDEQNYARIELSIARDIEDYERRHRRAILLGFKVECENAEHFLPNGEACTLYARIRSQWS